MDMGGLQRSEVSFRRQGSSGLVWDDRFLSGELNKIKKQEQEQEEGHNKKDDQHALKIKTNGGYRTGKPVSPAIDPPSPKLSGCGFCGAFGKSSSEKNNKNNKKGQRSR
ncbi:hypothetical protein PIB30_022436 [Stylosanthes scabra]|uniref:MAPK kinase substrate protein n=1 Tax=Stylosanthes scabra TaxID=79078 RepID=A0ABU6R9F1_9FABA|nr:hypothetical protein [Stylosanthes scabra]